MMIFDECSDMGAPPPLDYAQLFSFQVAFREKKGAEWEKVILELNFVARVFLLVDREHVIREQPFSLLTKCMSPKDSDDPLVSIFFGYMEWELNVQNNVEKECLLYLLECISKKMTAEEAVQHGIGIIGLDKRILKYGVILRKAKAKRKRTERFLVIVPGKLLIFAGKDILGRHVRFVTSLFRANVKVSFTRLEFQIVAHHSKEKEMGSWITALEKAIQDAERIARPVMSQVESSRNVFEEDERERYQMRAGHPMMMQPQLVPSGEQQSQESKEEAPQQVLNYDYEQRKSQHGRKDEQQPDNPEGHRRVSLSRQRLKAAIEDMSSMIGRLHVADRWHENDSGSQEVDDRFIRNHRYAPEYRQPVSSRRLEQSESSSDDSYPDDPRPEFPPFRKMSSRDGRHRQRQRHPTPPERLQHSRAEFHRAVYPDTAYSDRDIRQEIASARNSIKDFTKQRDLGGDNNTRTFREAWKHHSLSRMELPDKRRLDPSFLSRIY